MYVINVINQLKTEADMKEERKEPHSFNIIISIYIHLHINTCWAGLVGTETEDFWEM